MPINNYGANNPYAYNPMINQQNRLMQMEQQQYNNMYPQNNYFQQNNNNYLKGRLVTCLDEAKASMFDELGVLGAHGFFLIMQMGRFIQSR